MLPYSLAGAMKQRCTLEEIKASCKSPLASPLEPASDVIDGLDISPFVALVGQEMFDLIVENAPKKVMTRVGMALRHFTMAERLVGVDDDMGAIRLIAAEEELVVAIFEWLKLNAASMPEHGDFIRRYKNHLVKLAFYPVIWQMRIVLEDMVSHGITLEGLEDVLHWGVKTVRAGDRISLRIANAAGETVRDHNPLALAITLDGKTDEEVLESLYEQFKETVLQQHAMTVREFVGTRADFRNKLLYAEDGQVHSMAESLRFLIDEVFKPTLRDLLWCLAVLLTNEPAARNWGLVSQFVSLYRMVLSTSKAI